jgi:chaperonin GroEL (HSP60 family)
MKMGAGSGRLSEISESSTRVAGRDAQSTNISAARALSDVVRTTLGPKGMDKMLVGSDGKVIVTNDGASIVDRLDVEHPAARAVVAVASQQGDHVGDGTTTAVVLAGALLAEAEALLERGLHPTTVTDGYHRAAERVAEALQRNAVAVDADDTERLEAVARTAITGKWDAEATSFLARRVVEAVRAVARDGRVDFDRITRKAVSGGSVLDSRVVEGLVVDTGSSSTEVVSPEPGPPRRIDDARVALVDDGLTVESVDGARVTVDSAAAIERFQAYEDGVYGDHVDRIVDVGADVVFCQQSIDDDARYLLAKEGVLAVERTREDELHKLARATGARIVTETAELTADSTGRAGTVERRPVGPTRLVVVADCAHTEQLSLLLRGPTERIAEETKRVVDGCFYAVRHAVGGSVVPGGGATEVDLARVLRDTAEGIPDREAFAVGAFADALEAIPRTLAETAGLDAVDTLLELRTRHHGGDTTVGVDVESGDVDDMLERGVVDPTWVKQHAVGSATEAANLLLRVDDIVAVAAGSGGGHEGHDHDHDHGPGGVVESSGGYPWTLGH